MPVSQCLQIFAHLCPLPLCHHLLNTTYRAHVMFPLKPIPPATKSWFHRAGKRTNHTHRHAGTQSFTKLFTPPLKREVKSDPLTNPLQLSVLKSTHHRQGCQECMDQTATNPGLSQKDLTIFIWLTEHCGGGTVGWCAIKIIIS